MLVCVCVCAEHDCSRVGLIGLIWVKACECRLVGEGGQLKGNLVLRPVCTVLCVCFVGFWLGGVGNTSPVFLVT